MTDREFVDAFEACTLETFHHRDHVRLAWIYLRESASLLEALTRFTTSLKRFATAAGSPGLYHETITWAFLIAINERRHRTPTPDFDAFTAEHPDLLRWKPSILDALYLPETLASDRARHAFVLPDRLAG